MERLRRFARRRPEWAFRHNRPGFCSVCQEQIASALDVHMINVHLELGQLWRCRVEWCAVWKGSVSDCLGHLQDKHGGSQYVALNNLAKFFPPWTVPRDLCLTALRSDVSGIAVDARLFHEARCCLSLSPDGGGGWFPDCYRLRARLWPLRSRRICTYRFRHPERPRGRCRRCAFRAARLHEG